MSDHENILDFPVQKIQPSTESHETEIVSVNDFRLRNPKYSVIRMTKSIYALFLTADLAKTNSPISLTDIKDVASLLRGPILLEVVRKDCILVIFDPITLNSDVFVGAYIDMSLLEEMDPCFEDDPY
jgi:hypothetical protein